MFTKTQVQYVFRGERVRALLKSAFFSVILKTNDGLGNVRYASASNAVADAALPARPPLAPPLFDLTRQKGEEKGSFVPAAG